MSDSPDTALQARIADEQRELNVAQIKKGATENPMRAGAGTIEEPTIGAVRMKPPMRKNGHQRRVTMSAI